MNNVQSKVSDLSGVVVTSSYITDAYVSNIEDQSGTYTTALNVISSNDAVRRDAALAKAFTKNKSNLDDYGSSLHDLAVSLRKYRQILTSCEALVKKMTSLTTVKQFDDTAKDCNDAISSAKSITSSFSDQHLGAYIEQSTALLAAYRTIMMEAESGAESISYTEVSDINQKIVELRTTTLDLKPSVAITANLQELTDIINSEQRKFIR